MKFESARKHEHPSFLEAVRLYRAESNLTFEEAKARAKREFEKRGWELPHMVTSK